MRTAPEPAVLVPTTVWINPVVAAISRMWCWSSTVR